MSYRNDHSFLSFGARLTRAERDAAQAKTELADLKQSLPDNKDLQAAALIADVIKQQRRKQMSRHPSPDKTFTPSAMAGFFIA